MFQRYDVHPSTIGYQIAVVYAPSLEEAREEWKRFAVDGPQDVDIVLSPNQSASVVLT